MRGEFAWSGIMVEWGLIESFARDHMVWTVAPVRAHGFFEVLGCFRVWRDLGRDGGWVDQDWW